MVPAVGKDLKRRYNDGIEKEQPKADAPTLRKAYNTETQNEGVDLDTLSLRRKEESP